MLPLRLRCALALVVVFTLLPCAAYPQTGAASVTGIVLDETRAALPGVTVTATNRATGVPYAAVSNSSGN